MSCVIPYISSKCDKCTGILFFCKFLFKLDQGSFIKSFYHFFTFSCTHSWIGVLKYTYRHIDISCPVATVTGWQQLEPYWTFLGHRF